MVQWDPTLYGASYGNAARQPTTPVTNTADGSSVNAAFEGHRVPPSRWSSQSSDALSSVGHLCSSLKHSQLFKPCQSCWARIHHKYLVGFILYVS